MRPTCLSLLLTLVACSGSGTSASAPEPSQSAEPSPPASTAATFGDDGLLSGPGAPDRWVCAADGDCLVTDIPSSRLPRPPAHLAGCCPASGFDPMNRAFFEWMTAFQASHCPADRSACPPLPAPAMPSPCVHEPRCLEGRCANACGAPPAAEVP